AAQVTVGGQAARVAASGTFEAVLNLGSGVHDVPMQAVDKAGNTTNETWRVDNGSEGPRALTYDIEGNLLTDGRRAYTWDGHNRMTGVTMGEGAWTFDYDGESRRISETKNGAPVRQWTWHGTRIMEERQP